MRRVLRENGLSLTLLVIFLLFIVPQSITGQREYNQDQEEHGQPTAGYVKYLGEGHFIESVFENWESEFLQIFGYVLLTGHFRQKGSPESKKLEGDEPVDAYPSDEVTAGSPGLVRRGGAWLKLYSHSLSLAFALLFLMSMTPHAVGRAMAYIDHQHPPGSERGVNAEHASTARSGF